MNHDSMPTRNNPSQTNDIGARTDHRLGQIVRLLTDHPMLVVSGTKIAEELGTGRSEVWRLIEQLRELGVAIEGHPTEGYRLVSIPDLLLPEMLAPKLKGTIFAENIQHYYRVGSTSAAAMQAAAEGEREGAVFIAEEQTSGKGRGGHDWDSASSVGIYCSVILRPNLAPADVLVISLAAGLAVFAAAEELTGIRPDLRWPNDVLFGDKKFCGILTELNAEVTRVRYVVVGIGMNINQESFSGELQDIATSVRIETGRSWSRVDFVAALLKSLDREYRALLDGSVSAHKSILHRFEQRSSYARRREVHVEENGGYDGVTEGLDSRGFLQVRAADGLRTVLSGGVRARNAKI
ncbi:MAG TPA: biotin--[acetyl-CoA-carboxylase] ligase [Clostridia bacterium]|nr:biotin--[acetyl-CoA-carboxylase] ligase [Clostridia bacterium]